MTEKTQKKPSRRAKVNWLTRPLAEFRIVVYGLDHGTSGTSTSEHIVHGSEVDEFVAAIKKLHHEPGVNPYNNNAAAPLRYVEVWKPALDGPYWWTCADLGVNAHDDHFEGAQLVERGELVSRFVTPLGEETEPPDEPPD